MSPSLRQRRPRGQAAAMMAVTMVLIALMVALTLGIGMKAKEKMEVQTMADVSAYSGAVVTARTFNSISLLNRVIVAEMVSLVATESLLSYGSYYRTMLYAARDEYQLKIDAPCVNADPCFWCDRWTALRNAAVAEIARVDAQWPGFDAATHQNLRAQLGDAGAAHSAQLALYGSLMSSHLVGSGQPPLASAIVQRVDQASSWTGELTAPATVNPVNQRELGIAVDCDPAAPQSFCDGAFSAEISLKATLGTRYYDLETNATNLATTLEDSLLLHHGLSRANGDDVRVNGFQSSARFVNGVQEHGPPGTLGAMGEAMEGQLMISVTSNGCGPQLAGPSRVESLVYTTRVDSGNATHLYRYSTSGGGGGTLGGEPQSTHELGPCPPLVTPPCGIWPGYADLNPGHLEPGRRFTHLYGQPKVTMVVERNYQARGNRADPWNLLSTFRIRRGAATPEQFDNNGLRTAQGLDISRQTAVATGLVYYHRMRHWREPPNFFNPYWRATLVSGAIDLDGNPSRGGADLKTAVSGAQFAVDAIDELSRGGFRGWQ